MLRCTTRTPSRICCIRLYMRTARVLEPVEIMVTEPLHASNGHSLVDRRQLAKEGIVDDRTGDVTGFQKPRATVLVDVDGDAFEGVLRHRRGARVSVGVGATVARRRFARSVAMSPVRCWTWRHPHAVDARAAIARRV